MKHPSPPRLFLRFFKWFCDPELHRFIEGDLLELYGERVGALGKKKADRRFVRDVFLLFRPGIIRSFNWTENLLHFFHMVTNYFKIFRRNFKRQPTYNLLNLSCLSLGIAGAICIGLYLDFETTYDHMHSQADRLFRIETNAVKTHSKVMEVDWQTTPANLGPLALQDHPEISSFVRFFNFFSNNVQLKHGQTIIEETAEHIVAVDSNVFDLFSFELLQGDPKTALRGPNKIILSENLARRLFADEDPMGQLISTRLVHQLTGEQADYPLKVSGVYRDLPANTHLYFHAMMSAKTDPELDTYYFGRFNVYTYLLLHEQATSESLAPKLTGIYDRYLDPKRDQVLVNVTHDLVPLASIHLSETGGAGYLRIFSGIGILILLIAFIGYVNLVTAQAGKRALEIGLRKVLGSGRSQLMVQFLAESLFLTSLAVIVALVLVLCAIEPLNATLGLHLSAAQLLQPLFLLMLFAGTIGLGLIGGSYPAFFLSSFQPVRVLKGTLTRAAPLQRWLLGFQFAVVVFVLASTGMIYQQLQFLREKDLGFDSDHIVQLNLPGQFASGKLDVLQASLLRDPNILSLATCDFVPGVGGMPNRPASAQASEPQFIRTGRIDYNYLELMDIDMVAGRNFSPDFPADSTINVLVNETFVRNFELGADPLGTQVKFGDWGNPQALEIVGIVEDFHQSSLHAPIEPQLYRLGPTSGALVVKVAKDPAAAIRHLESTWKAHFPDQAIQYSFLHEELLSRYEEDQRRGQLFLLFSGITLFIAFAGLYGLAAYLTARRSREVGIRKVLGASLSDIVFLLSRHFLALVLIAALPGMILAWYTMRKWLENFAFRVSFSYSLLGMVLLSVFFLVLLTVGWQAARTAARNPREVLE